MSARKVLVMGWLITLVSAGSWAVGCAAVVGADDYKVAGGSAGSGGSCTMTGEKCEGAQASCCTGSCLDLTLDMPLGKFCAAPCMSGDDCQSGCCITQGGRMGCAPQAFCADTCLTLHSDCSNVAECCVGSRCICFNASCDDTTPGECVSICRTNAECDTGCCAALKDGSVKVCSPPVACAATPP
jgi:hypothetical protein